MPNVSDSQINLSESEVLTVNGLVNAVALALAIRNAAQTGTGQQTNATRNHTGLVADNVTEQVARNDDTVQASRVLDHDHRGTVNQLVLNLEIRELLLECLVHDLPPKSACGEHVRLIQRPNALLASAPGQETSQSRDSLDLSPRVRLRIHSIATAVVLRPIACKSYYQHGMSRPHHCHSRPLKRLTKVDTTRQLTNDNEISSLADRGLERRVFNKGVGSKEAWTQVSICAHLLAEAKKALLGADGASAPFRAADGTEQNGVRGFGSREGFFGKGFAVLVDRALYPSY